MVRIRHLFVSSGHNYSGHHQTEPGNHPVLELDKVECLAGRGLVGDRFFDFKPDYLGQITFFSWEVWEQLREELGVVGGSPAATRRNVITEGVDLNTLIGKQFEIQGVVFAGTEECRPCAWMNHALGHPQAETSLRGRGGLRAQILTNGVLHREPVAHRWQ